MKALIQRYLHHPLVAAILAMFIYGGWAAAVNADHGLAVALRSGLGQGVYAFIATFGVGILAIKTYHRFGRGLLGFSLGFVFSFALMLAIPLSVHTILATPDKWAAMSLGLVWGTLYLVWLLWMESRRGK